MGDEPLTTSAPRLMRLVPILQWSRTYDRSWLRGDLIAGIAVAAMIVPKDLGYAGIAGVPVENGLYAAAAAAIIYGLFCTSRHISTGPSSSLAAVAGGAVLVTGVSGNEAAQLVAAIASRDRSPVPAGRHPQARLAGQLPLAGGRDRLPCRRRHRRRHRRAAQAHRDLRRRRERLAGVRVVGPRPGRSQPGDAGWSGWWPLPSSSGFVSRFQGSPARSSSWSAASSARSCSTSERTASRWWAPFRAACRFRRCHRSSSCRRTSRPSSSRPSRCC